MKLTRLFTLLICVFNSIVSPAQENTIKFSYDESGNMIQRSLQVFVGGRINRNAIDSNFTPAPNFKIFPNPTNTSLNIEGDLPEDISEAKLSLLNVNGQLLKKDIYLGQLKTINVTDLKSGMYILEVKYSEKKRNSYKIIVTN